MPRRPCGPPRNDNGFLSFRGAERRGNPSFLRWTGDGPPRSSAPTPCGGAARRGRRALRVVAESRRDCPGQRRTAERLRQRSRGNRRETEQKSPPKGASTPDNPSVTAAPCQLPLHKGAFPCGGRGDRTGDADCRVASLLAMTVLNLCHSEEAQRADVGIRPFCDGRWSRPPYLGHGLRRPNFVPKFGASVRSSAPTESPINHPSQPARSEAFAPAWARDGRESAQRPSQKGDRLRDCRCSA